MSKDALLVNKVAAGVLSAGLIAMGLGILSNLLYSPHKLAHNAYAISDGGEVAESGVAEAEAKPDIIAVSVSDMLATANIEKGVKLTKKCASCHTFDKGGADKLGPNLYNIIDRPIADIDGFSYSAAMADKGGDWGYEELNYFLAKPKKYLKGTKMQFAGLKKPQDRADLIAYLRTLSANPVPLP